MVWSANGIERSHDRKALQKQIAPIASLPRDYDSLITLQVFRRTRLEYPMLV
jgi:hypothetical protein